VVGAIVGLTVILTLGAIAYAAVVYDRVWDVALPDTRASTDPAVIARGEYLVHGPAHCSDCHTPPSARDRVFRGEVVPLTGGTEEATWLGTWVAPNLTSDTISGIGRLTDGQIARTLRTGVDRDGRIALPFKDTFADMAEGDLVAILSYLRTLPPEPGAPPKETINLFGKITLAYFIRPYGPAVAPPPALVPDTSAAYGGYLANVLGRCGSCHTPRDLKTGEYLGPRFSGGLPFDSRLRPGTVYVSPNLTPDPETGHIVDWTEEGFITRMRTGATIQDSPMPWGSYMRMTDGDLRALYRYLMRLDPVRRDNGPMVQVPAD
jgi:mono/diheme cytochrome c family protein